MWNGKTWTIAYHFHAFEKVGAYKKGNFMRRHLLETLDMFCVVKGFGGIKSN